MATRAITNAVQSSDVIDLAVPAFGSATRFCAAILRATFCGRACEPPNVLTLPGSTTCIGAPRASALAGNDFVAPVAATDFSGPLRQNTGNAFSHKWR
jgi:hypothetical protein